MTYDLLSIERRLALLKERLLHYETLHFQQVCELEIATRQELTQVIAESEKAIKGFEDGIAWVKDEISKLENAA